MDTNPYAAPTAPTEVAPTAASGAVRVGFWPRFGALMIDTVIIFAVGIPISGAVAAAFPEFLAKVLLATKGTLDPKAVAMMPQLTVWTEMIARWGMGIAVFGSAYCVLTEGFFGRALGKWLLGLRIADVEARRASVWRLLGRAALRHSHWLLTVAAIVTNQPFVAKVAQGPRWIIIIGCFFVFADHRRALHDLALGTAVYRNSDVTP